MPPVVRRLAKLRLNILSACDIKNTETFSRQDPYCLVELHTTDGKVTEKFRTRTSKNAGTNPVWNHQCELEINDHHMELFFNIYNENFGSDSFIGTVRVPIQMLVGAQERSYCLPVIRHGKQKGTMNIAATYNQYTQQNARTRSDIPVATVYPPFRQQNVSTVQPQAGTVGPYGNTSMSSQPQTLQQKYYPGIGAPAAASYSPVAEQPTATTSTLPYYNPGPQQGPSAPQIENTVSPGTQYSSAAPQQPPQSIPVAYPTPQAQARMQPPPGYPGARPRNTVTGYATSTTQAPNYNSIYPPPQYR